MVVWPLPREFERGSTVVWLSPEVQYAHYVKNQALHDVAMCYKGLKRAQSSVSIFVSDCNSTTNLFHYL